jgi:hypothetical protein
MAKQKQKRLPHDTSRGTDNYRLCPVNRLGKGRCLLWSRAYAVQMRVFAGGELLGGIPPHRTARRIQTRVTQSQVNRGAYCTVAVAPER